ncbi:MAG: error-prone DNA polymerase [Anaerolineae bacterium]|nr:error-prone DNA polymerase [Anaerolineae bacterium]
MSPSNTDYVELHCHSNFSLLDGASHPEDLIIRAAELSMPVLALTDHDAVYGAVRFAHAAQQHGVKPIFGSELTLESGHHLTLLVENAVGWRNLCQLISLARHNAPKGDATLPLDALPDRTEGLIALSGCKRGEVASALRRQDEAAARAAARRYRAWFGPEQFWIELQHHLQPDDSRLQHGLVEIARQLDLNYVATNNVHYARRMGRPLQDVLVCIRHHTALDEAGPHLRPNSEFYLKSARQLAPLFKDYPQALTNTRRIAERCQFDLRYGLQELPNFPTPSKVTATDYLRSLCNAAVDRADPDDQAARQLAHELTIIAEAGLSNYFLIVWDIVRFAREKGIRCQGRGSAANSLVAYLLGISPIDPLAHDLVFERFLSAERAVVPDIDLDFDAQRREEVIQYVYERYSHDHAAMACTFVTFQARSAWRDVAKALGLSPNLRPDDLGFGRDEAPAQPFTPPLNLVQDLCRQIDDFPRHLGLHNGGMIITGVPLTERVPTEPATMPDRVVVQWDKEGLEAVGLVKIDLLGLRMLSAIDEAVTLVGEQTGQLLDLADLTFDDPAVYDLISHGNTIGLFQVESRAQAQLQPRLKPTCFNDLIVAISLIRPGPLQGNMVHPYLRRRQGLEPVTYLHPNLEPALAETLGVILFQEQVLKVARDLAGFTPGQGELLRRALGSKRGEAAVEKLRADFLIGAAQQGVSEVIATEVFDQLRAFGGYAFAKSHATAFAVLVYQSAWLKHYHPAAFYCGLMNNQPMGFWNPAVLVGDARRHGIEVLPVEIYRSRGRCTIEHGALRLGFNYVDGFGEVIIDRLEAARQHGSFTKLADFCRRTRLPQRLIERLILAGAFDAWSIPRRKLLWELGQLHYKVEELDFIFATDGVDLPEPSRVETTTMERSVLGLSTGEHVMTFYRPWLIEHGILGSWELIEQTNGRRVRVAGLVVVHQAPPTAKGFHFITLEDQAGLIDTIFRPQIYARYKNILRRASLLVIEGIVQREENVTNLLVERVADLPPLSPTGMIISQDN